MPSISDLYKQVYTILDSACFVMSAVNIPDGSWGLELEFSNFESFQELIAYKDISGS